MSAGRACRACDLQPRGVHAGGVSAAHRVGRVLGHIVRGVELRGEVAAQDDSVGRRECQACGGDDVYGDCASVGVASQRCIRNGECGVVGAGVACVYRVVVFRVYREFAAVFGYVLRDGGELGGVCDGGFAARDRVGGVVGGVLRGVYGEGSVLGHSQAGRGSEGDV